MPTPWVVVFSAFMLMCLLGFVWHESVGVRVAQREVRFEAQRGEIACSFWLGNDAYPVEAPLLWCHAADARTTLAAACARSYPGIGWRLIRGHQAYGHGVSRGGAVVSWWFALFWLIACMYGTRFAAQVLRHVRRSLPGDPAPALTGPPGHG